ncbi:aspartyl/asparaginyl beta-hydroxylase domain-containing protein [Alteromonas gilva]|uniref:Aspartyl/asparaginyl beta-hydroxylase domain-containing protein n=1 Tax=Alteromonas gilva TaxID=2987522 RepID=A0ABT5L7K0_9ALTE|nr:aspartyl/asparaginyl beta-hydroxylase domain-containing protein [Alteromonas gilva]MDC8832466.1 aspartyl/asparaginyl beta-hydroxylase domain-containing protein [Alteromonas gilva]
MYIEEDFRPLGEVNIKPLAAYVNELSDTDWMQDSHRQQTYAPHKQTQTIPLLFDEDLRHQQATAYPHMTELAPLLEPVYTAIAGYFASSVRQRALARRYGEPYFQRIILVRLAAGGCIDLHADHGFSLSRCHRIHVPILSHPQVLFQVGDSERCLLPGEIWEINNRRIHGVTNRGCAPRVHLILDYVMPGEKIFEPDAVLQA